VSNIPYNISEPLLMKLIGYDFKLAVLTIGESFARILTIRDNTSRLSIIAPAYFDVEIKEIVSREAFEPQPRTKSAVIILKPRAKEELSPELFITRELWQQRTKKTINALREAIINLCTLQNKTRMTKNQARDVLAKMKLDSKLAEKTVETLSGKQFYEIVTDLSQIFSPP
jgi:16S rRNA (adenine1518-N6/adenine1519-N6)-dimethyltransferase